MSGLQSSVVHLLDVFLGRHEYSGELGALAMAERPWLPSLHNEFFRRLAERPVRAYVVASGDPVLRGRFDELVRAFGSEEGFLGVHRIKIMGYVEQGNRATPQPTTATQHTRSHTHTRTTTTADLRRTCLTRKIVLCVHPAKEGQSGGGWAGGWVSIMKGPVGVVTRKKIVMMG